MGGAKKKMFQVYKSKLGHKFVKKCLRLLLNKPIDALGKNKHLAGMVLFLKGCMPSIIKAVQDPGHSAMGLATLPRTIWNRFMCDLMGSWRYQQNRYLPLPYKGLDGELIISRSYPE